jgi:hypothetical protein
VIPAQGSSTQRPSTQAWFVPQMPGGQGSVTQLVEVPLARQTWPVAQVTVAQGSGAQKPSAPQAWPAGQVTVAQARTQSYVGLGRA